MMPRRQPEKGRAPSEEGSDASQAKREGRKIVLLVDDEPDILHSLKEFLESKLGVRALLASDAESALRILTTVKPHLMIVDQMLPGMTGLMLIQEARKVHPTLVAVLVTGQPQQAAALVAVARDGLTHGFMKPLTTAPFVERLRELLH